MEVAQVTTLWWDPKKSEQRALWESSLTLTERFYSEIVRYPALL